MTFLSGFCNPSNPPDSHARCHGAAGDDPCICTCHTETGATVNDQLTDTDITPGFYPDVPEADYHNDRTSLSHSGAKEILRSPEHYRWRLDHPEHKDVFDFGSAAHALVLDRGIESIYVAPFDNWQTKLAQTERKLAREDGLSPILPKDWAVVCDMAEKLAGHSLAMDLLSEGQPEVSAYAIHTPTGVLRRCRFDYLTDEFGVDYKSTVTSEPHAFVRNAATLKYHVQHPWYLDLARDLGHQLRGFLFIAQEKEAPYTVTVIELPAALVEAGRVLTEIALERYAAAIKSDRWPGYRPDDVVATGPAPGWALYTDQYESPVVDEEAVA